MFPFSAMQKHLKVITSSEFSYDGQDFKITFTQAGVMVDQEQLQALDAEEASLVGSTLACYEVAQVRAQMKDEQLSLKVNGKELVLTQGKHFTLF